MTVDRRTHILEALIEDAGARLGAFAWLLAADDDHAAQLFNAGLDGVAARWRGPRSGDRAEAIARHAMAMKAATDARRQREAQPSPAPARVPSTRSGLGRRARGRCSLSSHRPWLYLWCWSILLKVITIFKP